MTSADTVVESIETPSLTIQYRQAGDGEIPLVFLHGNYASSRWWLPQFKRLPQNTRAYAPDLRGCGTRSALTTLHQRPNTPLTISDLAGDLLEFITTLGIHKPVLVGHSLGGLVATEFAVQHPDVIRCLVLEDTGPPGNIAFLPLPGTLLLPLEMGGKVVIKRALRIAGLSKRGAYTKALISDALAAKPGQYLAFSQAVVKWNVKAELRNLTMPVQLIWGGRDLIMPLRIGKQYHQALPKSELVVIGKAGHSPHLEAADTFASALAGFLEKHCSGDLLEPG